jgi:hypothetical protein
MNKFTSPEEQIFKDLIREPKGYFYVERGESHLQVTNDTGTYRISVKKVVPRKSKNRPNWGFKPKGFGV